jgi:hypothetical protein
MTPAEVFAREAVQIFAYVALSWPGAGTRLASCTTTSGRRQVVHFKARRGTSTSPLFQTPQLLLATAAA